MVSKVAMVATVATVAGEQKEKIGAQIGPLPIATTALVTAGAVVMAVQGARAVRVAQVEEVAHSHSMPLKP
jgi:hypothetical protein